MLKNTHLPATYDLVGLANRGIIMVGRESEAAIRLDSAEVPFLLSRRHASIQFQPDGRIVLKDLNSTNGTYASRLGQSLCKLSAGFTWDLQEGDRISFGGPESIVARSQTVANPFIFSFSALFDNSAEEFASIDAAAEHRRSINDLQGDQDASPKHDNVVRQLNMDDDPNVPKGLNHHHVAAAPSGQITAASRAQLAATHRQADQSASPSPGSLLMKGILASHFVCPICQDWLVSCHALSCGHMFCGPCLVDWLPRKQSCPSCRKPVAGVPVRCFQVDNTINDLLDKCAHMMSPNTRCDRIKKTQAWECVQQKAVPDWAVMLNERKKKASGNAARHHREFMGPVGQ